MAIGFIPSPEKGTVQNRLWLPQIGDFWAHQGSIPLRVLCFPGRRCSFLKVLLRKGYTAAGKVTCVERDPTEALLIRGQLADIGDGKGPVAVDIVQEGALSYLTAADDQAVGAKFEVVDLDLYGRLEDEKSELLGAVRAIVDVQHRANVKDWLLLLTTEAGSARGGQPIGPLRQAVAALENEYGVHISDIMGPRLPDSAAVPDVLRRYAALASACVTVEAFSQYGAVVRGAPRFYRGSDEYGRPGRRALMMAVVFRLGLNRKTPRGLGRKEHDAAIAAAMPNIVARARASKAIVHREGDHFDDTDELARLSTE